MVSAHFCVSVVEGLDERNSYGIQQGIRIVS